MATAKEVEVPIRAKVTLEGAEVRPGDSLVILAPPNAPDQYMEEMRERLQFLIPGVRILIVPALGAFVYHEQPVPEHFEARAYEPKEGGNADADSRS